MESASRYRLGDHGSYLVYRHRDSAGDPVQRLQLERAVIMRLDVGDSRWYTM